MNKVQELDFFLKNEPLPNETEYLRRAKNFTVLMATYVNDNVENLRIAIKSVIHNTVVPDEIVIMVDGPIHQQMKATIRDFEKKYPNVMNIIYQSDNRGRGYTASRGVINSKNELIARMDADDIAHPNRFETQLQMINSNKYFSVVGGQIYEFDDDLQLTTRRVVPSDNEQIRHFSKLRSPFNQPTVMFRKKDVLAVGNYHDLPVMEDYDLWMRMIEKNMIFHNIEQDLVYMRAPKDMYSRRGGFKYLSIYHEFRKRLLRKHLISYKDYYKSMIGMSISSLMPNIFREKLYKKLLRNN